MEMKNFYNQYKHIFRHQKHLDLLVQEYGKYLI